MRTRYVGRPQRRSEDDRFLTGRGSFVADLPFERLAHAAFVRSRYARADIVRVDVAAAKAHPGVVGVLTARDLAGRVGTLPTAVSLSGSEARKPPRPALAADRARYAGEAIAAVFAEDPYVARDAADLVQVEYEPRRAVTDGEKALREGAPLVHDGIPGNRAFRYARSWGDAARIFRDAEVVVSQRIVNQRLQPAPLETRAVAASWDPGAGRLTVHVNAQNPHEHREILATALRVPEPDLRVVSPDVGGGFGCKAAVYPEEIVLGVAARTLRRPVRWLETRTEHFLATTHGRDSVHRVELAARRDGTILALRVRSVANLGAYLSLYGPYVPTSGFAPILSGCYRPRAIDVEVLGAFTHTTPTDAYRGAGRPEAAYLVERIVDVFARKVGLDPADVRRRNFIPRDAFPHRVVTGLVYDSGDYDRTLRLAMEAIGYGAFRREQARARETGRLLGIGLSTYVEMCGVGPGTVGSATVSVSRDGTVRVGSGGHPHGQGGETSIAQIVADALQLPIESVRVVHGDTAEVPSGVGTYGSRTTAVEGGAAVLAAREVVERGRRIAAGLLEARTDDVVLEDGAFRVKGVPGPATTWQDVAREGDGDLSASAEFDPDALVFPFGAHACTVEVDPETGRVGILRYVTVDDCGTAINPMLVEGQVHGGVLQGIAQALWEAAAYDEDGNLLTSTFLEYLMPTAVEGPAIETHRTETPTPRNPLGAKGIGEAGAIAAPQAVVNAVVDALAPYGVVHLDMPLTPEKVWRAIGTRGKG